MRAVIQATFKRISHPVLIQICISTLFTIPRASALSLCKSRRSGARHSSLAQSRSFPWSSLPRASRPLSHRVTRTATSCSSISAPRASRAIACHLVRRDFDCPASWPSAASTSKPQQRPEQTAQSPPSSPFDQHPESPPPRLSGRIARPFRAPCPPQPPPPSPPLALRLRTRLRTAIS